MIISKTPYRISFFGGGTDYPSWFKENNDFKDGLPRIIAGRISELTNARRHILGLKR